MAPDDLPPVHLLLLEALQAQARDDRASARRLLCQARELDPTHAGVLYSLAALDANEGHPEEALASLDAAVTRQPDFAPARLARAQVLLQLGRRDSAIAEARIAVQLDASQAGARQLLASLAPEEVGDLPIALSEAIPQAQALQAQGQVDAAIAFYGRYLMQARDGLQHIALHNAGVLLSQVGRRLEAEAYLRQSVACKPDFVPCSLTLGQLVEGNGRPHDALEIWQAALPHASAQTPQGRSERQALLNQIGRVREVRREYPEAEAALAESLDLVPDQPAAQQHWIHLRQKQCAWPVIPGPEARRRDLLNRTSALAMLGLSDDPADQLAAAQRFVAEKVGRFARQVPRGHGYGHQRLRIGYLSSDLSMHAVSLLTVELFERHRRDRVEVHAFCWSREDGTAFRERVRRAFDRFHRIDQIDDEAAARLIQAEEIDVLVDLQGLTSNARPNIVARGPAPLQVAYLGLPGPTALPHQDRVVADPFVFPDALRDGFTEAPLMLQTLYQCSDSQREFAPLPTREQLGLPQDAFVFCAFNNNFKFTPEVFEIWMRLLRQLPGAVLWLLADNPWSRANMEAAARGHGVDPQRLVFAPRVLPADYMARFTAADLFLDTYPFNAGTTANDALWAGLPLLTRAGRTYVSRMAGSLLTSAGLHELVTYDVAEYERVALDLARDPLRLKGLRDRLAEEKRSGRLFSTDRFVAEFEDALRQALHQNP